MVKKVWSLHQITNSKDPRHP